MSREPSAPRRAGASQRGASRSGQARRGAAPTAGSGGARPGAPRPRAHGGRVFAVAIVAFAGLLVAHHFTTRASPSRATAHHSAPPSYSVGLTSCTFVDPTRDTHDYVTGTTISGRTLVTEIRYPSLAKASPAGETSGASPARRDGPFPLIVFAHGYDLTPASYAPLLDAWVRAGFVVAAPVFPDTNATAVAADHDESAPESDIINQPGDVAFVTHSVLAANTDGAGCPALDHLVAPSKVALAGQSDGATTVAALAYSSAYALPGTHYVAAAVLSGSELSSPTSGGSNDYRAQAGDPALLVVQSAADQCNPPQQSIALYDAVDQPDRWFLELEDAHHLPPYTDVPPNLSFAAVAAVTARFFTLEFAGEKPGAGLRTLGDRAGVSRLTTGTAPVLPELAQLPATCYEQ